MLRHNIDIALVGDNALTQCAADMIILAFFVLLQPGDFTVSTSETTPFNLEDVQLFIGGTHINLNATFDGKILSATLCTVTFTTRLLVLMANLLG